MQRLGDTLLNSAKTGNIHQLRIILSDPEFDRNVLDNVLDEEGNSALHLASCGGYVDCVSALLRAGADIEARNKKGSSPLCVACSCSDDGATAQSLLDNGADVNSAPANEQMPISEACRRGNVNIVRLLLSRGSSPEATHYPKVGFRLIDRQSMSASYPWQPIHFAVESGSIECIHELLKAGACVNMPGKYDESALVEAITHRKFECARFLLKHGADIGHLNSKCESPLGKALMDPESGDFVSMLYQFGANMTLKRRDGIEGTRVPHHPLWDWLLNGSSPEPLRALVMADTASSVGNDRWKFWKTRALFIVVSSQNITHLIHFINVSNSCGHLLDMSVKYSDELISKVFFAKVNQTLMEQSLRTYMHQYSHGQNTNKKNALEIMKILLASGASATELCGSDPTLSPLQLAKQNRLSDAVNVLIEGHAWSRREKRTTSVKFGSGMFLVLWQYVSCCLHAHFLLYLML